MKRFFGYIMIVLLFGGSICGIVFGVELVQANKQIDSLYTEEEVEEKYKDYINLIVDRNAIIEDLNVQVDSLSEENKQYETTISSLQNSISEKDSQIETLTSEKSSLSEQVETLNSQIFDLNSQIETLSEDKDKNLAQIEELQLQKSDLESQVETLSVSISEKDKTISNLTLDKENLEEEIETLSASISDNQTTISNLNSQILTLQNEITRLEGLLEAYEDYVNQSITLTYYVDNVLFDTQVITRGETTSQAKTPEDTDKYSFVKWQINGEDFDFSNYNFTMNTRIDAVVNYNIYNVKFIYNNEEYYSCEVYGGDYVSGFTAPEIEDETYQFKGVSLSSEDVNIIDLASYKITSDLVFYVIVEPLYPSIQTYSSDSLQTEYSVASVSDYETLATLTNAGNTFEGITIYQTKDIDFSGVDNWIPIGNVDNKFMGNFDGLNHTISNFSYSGDLSYILDVCDSSIVSFGLFGYAKGFSNDDVIVFENIKFSNVNISISKGSLHPSYIRGVGILFGQASSVMTSNIVFESGVVSGFKLDSYNIHLGDLAGYVSGGFLGADNCVSYIDFSDANRVNLLFGSSNVHDCISYSDVNNVKYLLGLKDTYRVGTTTEYLPSNNKSYGIFTDVESITGLPSYVE